MIDRYRKACEEAVRTLGTSNPSAVAKYVLRQLHPDLIRVWYEQPISEEQNVLLEQIAPVAETVCSSHEEQLKNRVATVVKTTIEVMKEDGMELEAAAIAATAFRILYPEISNPAHPIHSGLRKKAMWPVLHEAVKATYREAN